MTKISNKIKIALVPLVVSFVLLFVFVYIGLTNAWFSKNRTLNVSGMSVVIARDGSAKVDLYEIFKRNGNEDKAEKVSDSNNPQSIEITEYDTIFEDDNVNTPIVIRVVLSEIPEDNPPLELTCSCVADHWTNTNIKSGILQAQFSNVCDIWADCIPELDKYSSTTEANEIYLGVIEHFKNVDGSTFAKVNNGANVRKDTTFTINFDSNEPESDKVVFYIMLDYNTELAFALIDQNNYDVTQSEAGKDTIPLPFDLNSFEIKYDFSGGDK